MEAVAAQPPELPPPLPPPPWTLNSLDRRPFEEDHQYQEELKESKAAWKRYEEEYDEYKKTGEAHHHFVEELKARMDWGRDVAVSLLPEKPQKGG